MMKECQKTVTRQKTARDGKFLASSFDMKRQHVTPHSTNLLTLKLRRELQRIWDTTKILNAADNNNNHTDKTGVVEEVDVPPFKVGSMEMYRRFPKQYNFLMCRHDCHEVQEYLEDILSVLQQPSTSVNSSEECVKVKKRHVRVADFGCGTGRIASMVARHSAVGAVYCYDSEAAMLKQCLVNIVQSVSETRTDLCGVRVCYTATKGNVNASKSDDNDDSDVFLGNDNSGDMMVICAQPVSFADVQRGFLTDHPPCHLVVCAWSLSYVMRAQWGEDRWHNDVDATLNALIRLLDTSGAAVLVVIETLGTDTTEPRRNNTLPMRLESHYGFTRRWVRTDYKFRDVDEAVRLTRFFFGETMARRMAEQERTTLPECTGIWTLWRK